MAQRKRSSGFTLLEVLIASAIGAMVVLFGMSTLSSFQRGVSRGVDTATAEAELDNLIKLVVPVFRNAIPPGYTAMAPMVVPPPPGLAPAPPSEANMFSFPNPPGPISLSANFALPSGTPAPAPSAAFNGGIATQGMTPCEDLLVYRHQPVVAAGQTYIGTEAVYFTTVCNTNSTRPGKIPALFTDVSCASGMTSLVIRSYLTFGGAFNPSWNTAPPDFRDPLYEPTFFPKDPINIRNIAACFRQTAAGGDILLDVRAQAAAGDEWNSGRYIPVDRQITLTPQVAGSSEILPPNRQM